MVLTAPRRPISAAQAAPSDSADTIGRSGSTKRSRTASKRPSRAMSMTARTRSAALPDVMTGSFHCGPRPSWSARPGPVASGAGRST